MTRAMAHIAQTISVTPQMYRHFAVITVVATAMIAFFADGEQREAVADHIERRQANIETRRIEQQKLSARGMQTKLKDNRKASVWSGRAEDRGEAMDPGAIQEAETQPAARRPPVSRPPSAMSPEAQMVGGSIADLPDVPPPGMPTQVYQRLKKIQAMRKSKRGPEGASEAQLRQISEASAQRAGVESEDTD